MQDVLILFDSLLHLPQLIVYLLYLLDEIAIIVDDGLDELVLDADQGLLKLPDEDVAMLDQLTPYL